MGDAGWVFSHPNGPYRVPGGTARPAHPLGVLPGLSLPVFLARQANRTPYGRACAADAFASRRGPLLG